MAKIKVRAKNPNLEVPRERMGRAQMIGADVVEVEDSVYYRRQIQCGDLVEVVEPPAQPLPPASSK